MGFAHFDLMAQTLQMQVSMTSDLKLRLPEFRRGDKLRQYIGLASWSAKLQQELENTANVICKRSLSKTYGQSKSFGSFQY